MRADRPFPALCTWTDNGPDENWTLQVGLPASAIPAEAAPGDEQEIFVDLNGVTDRRNVPGGIMTRRPARDEGGQNVDSADATRYSIELAVPRGYRGALRFLPVPRGLQVADRPTWLDVLERGFVPAGDHGLRTVTDMRRKQILELAAPDARPLIWTGGGRPATDPRSGEGVGRSAVDEQVITLGSAPRRIWTHRPQRSPASAPVLVVFDGERFIRGGLLAAIDELVSPPSAVIAVDHAPVGDDGPDEDAAVGQRADDLVMNPRFCDDVLALVRQTAPEVWARTIVAGASYGGLAAAFFSLRHPEAFRGICLSPSFWETDDQGRRIWDLTPDSTDDDPDGLAERPESRMSETRTATAARPTFCVDHGILETVIADSVAEATKEFGDRGIDVAPRPFVGGHEYLWWRELMLVRLAEVLAE
ncbi:alpha/beta hydrolase-fold protein [Brevibacterium sp. SIMBA_078]|uniref:alpha/beta hydrolase n=1 Tax=Brevibacterium sp. SIMBA_078 TaxID=3085816 RepID=UPI00397D63B2